MQRTEQDSRLPEDLLRLVQPVRKVQAGPQNLGKEVQTQFNLIKVPKYYKNLN